MTSRHKQRVIILETRNPRTKEEKGLFGRTYVPINGDIFQVYLNAKQGPVSMLDTLIHELLHVVCGIATFKPALKNATEEARVRKAATAVIKILTNDTREGVRDKN
jgi:hypothetical protein